jgi:hypothetical protein
MTLRWSDGRASLGPIADVNFVLEPNCPLCETPGTWRREGQFLLIDCEPCGPFAVERNAPFPTPLEGGALRIARIELQTLRGLGGPEVRPLFRP